LRRRLVDNAFELMRAEYEWEVIGKTVNALYTTIVEGRKR
jgi:hypothetical protein